MVDYMPCDMCGKDAQLFSSKIEGVVMAVCGNCSKFGKVIAKVVVKTPTKVKRPVISVGEDPIERVIREYPGIIKKAREEKALEQKELGHLMAERESVVSNVESGSLKPSLKLARKFERVLGITLVQVEELKEIKLDKPVMGSGMTIGDLLKK